MHEFVNWEYEQFQYSNIVINSSSPETYMKMLIPYEYLLAKMSKIIMLFKKCLCCCKGNCL